MNQIVILTAKAHELTVVGVITMERVFINKNNQLRSGWKIAILLLVYEIISFIIVDVFSSSIGFIADTANRGTAAPSQISAIIINLINNNLVLWLIMSILDFACLMLVINIILRIIDKKRFKDIGLMSVFKRSNDFVFGLLMGAISMTLIFLVLLATGNITLRENLLKPNFSMTAAVGIITYIIVGIKEEVLSRGYCINVLNQMNNPALSVFISSIIFSALHLFNPNVKLFGLINIVLVGFLLGFMYLKSGNLWMPIGYHIAWNYFQGSVFGFPVSGITQKGVYSISVYQDNLLTGGSFGPEAGVLATIVIILGFIYILQMKNKRKKTIEI
jgi:uncharacterized protein